jgi:hypothetical protein
MWHEVLASHDAKESAVDPIIGWRQFVAATSAVSPKKDLHESCFIMLFHAFIKVGHAM